MATKKTDMPLMVRADVTTPPSSRTGGRLIDELDQVIQSRSVYKIPVHYGQKSYFCTLEDLVGGWDDLRFPATAVNPPGLESDPDFDTTRGGWLFDAGGTEVLFIIGQLPHTYKEGTGIRPHIHWIQENAGDVYWQLEYKWVNNNDRLPAAFTTLPILTKAFSYATSSPDLGLTQINYSDEIVGTGKKASSILMMKVSRVGGNAADTYTGDALMVEFDIHYQSDGHGTQLEYTKLD